MAHSIRIGISGWTYIPWRKTFYPEGLAQRRELEFASRQVNSIEINGSFYSFQKPSSYLKWAETVPDNFIFSLKAHRFITHVKKLNAVEEPLANFFASGLLALGPKLGPILWQFPPSMKFNAERFQAFVDLLPSDFKAASRLARQHSSIMKKRDFIPSPRSQNFRIRHAVEVRHESFRDPAFFKMLKKANIALVTADTAGKWPLFEEVTSDFAYVRLHGDVELYASGYTQKALDHWATQLKKWKTKRDIYVYFDNDIKVQAPYNAVSLLQRMIKGYQPESPMNREAVAGLQTPGPRLSGTDSRWRKRPGRAQKLRK